MKKLLLFILALAPLFVACSEGDDSEGEYDNWQQRNEAFLASVANDSLRGANWQRFKKFSYDQTTEGDVTDYIYVKKIESGAEIDVHPAYTDSVRIIYQGRLIPSMSYPRGYCFDSTAFGTYSPATSSTSRMKVSGTVDGFATALMNMKRGDYWRVYIPAELGYGASETSSIPAYSVLIYDITLIDFSAPGTAMKPWS